MFCVRTYAIVCRLWRRICRSMRLLCHNIQCMEWTKGAEEKKITELPKIKISEQTNRLHTISWANSGAVESSCNNVVCVLFRKQPNPSTPPSLRMRLIECLAGWIIQLNVTKIEIEVVFLLLPSFSRSLLLSLYVSIIIICTPFSVWSKFSIKLKMYTILRCL